MKHKMGKERQTKANLQDGRGRVEMSENDLERET